MLQKQLIKQRHLIRFLSARNNWFKVCQSELISHCVEHEVPSGSRRLPISRQQEWPWMYLCLCDERTNQILTCLLLSGISDRDLMRNESSKWFSACFTISDPHAHFRHHVCAYLIQNIRELPQLAQLHQVEPRYIQDPLGRFRWAGLQVQRGSTWMTSRWQIKYNSSCLAIVMRTK